MRLKCKCKRLKKQIGKDDKYKNTFFMKHLREYTFEISEEQAETSKQVQLSLEVLRGCACSYLTILTGGNTPLTGGKYVMFGAYGST